MPLSHVTIIPGFGWQGDKGFTLGRQAANLLEIDMIDFYVDSMARELQEIGVRVVVLPTRARPGLSEIEILEAIEPQALVVRAGAGYYGGKASIRNNKGRVHFGKGQGRIIAARVEEALHEWGRRSYFHYVVSSCPSSEETVIVADKPDAVCLRVEPFLINAPGASELASHLATLGRDLGRAIAHFIPTARSLFHVSDRF